MARRREVEDVTDRDQGPKDIDTGERMAVLAGATADAMRLKGRGEHETEGCQVNGRPPSYLIGEATNPTST